VAPGGRAELSAACVPASGQSRRYTEPGVCVSGNTEERSVWIAYGMAGLVVCIRVGIKTRNGSNLGAGNTELSIRFHTLHRTSAHRHTTPRTGVHRRAIHSMESPTANSGPLSPLHICTSRVTPAPDVTPHRALKLMAGQSHMACHGPCPWRDAHSRTALPVVACGPHAIGFLLYKYVKVSAAFSRHSARVSQNRSGHCHSPYTKTNNSCSRSNIHTA